MSLCKGTSATHFQKLWLQQTSTDYFSNRVEKMLSFRMLLFVKNNDSTLISLVQLDYHFVA